MTEERYGEDRFQNEMHVELALGLWKGLGFEGSGRLTSDEMLDIIGAKINSGEITPEQIRAALDSKDEDD
jgi:hypothetical protein